MTWRKNYLRKFMYLQKNHISLNNFSFRGPNFVIKVNDDTINVQTKST